MNVDRILSCCDCGEGPEVDLYDGMVTIRCPNCDDMWVSGDIVDDGTENGVSKQIDAWNEMMVELDSTWMSITPVPRPEPEPLPLRTYTKVKYERWLD